MGVRAGGVMTAGGVQIAGTGMHPFGRHGELSATAMGATMSVFIEGRQ